jgi:hypothetical protein
MQMKSTQTMRKYKKVAGFHAIGVKSSLMFCKNRHTNKRCFDNICIATEKDEDTTK